jgi:hypothetical protein
MGYLEHFQDLSARKPTTGRIFPHPARKGARGAVQETGETVF